MKQNGTRRFGLTLAVCLATAAPALAAWPGDPPACKSDAVKVGSVCMDKYEASIWEVPNATTTNAGLVKKIQKGSVTLADLANAGATARGVSSADYPCAANGQDCKDKIFAVSIPNVPPSAYITWFQALAACGNARKLLPTNDQWQQAVEGTPDPGADNGTTDCNTTNMSALHTGSRSGCVSAWGAYDMVGNVYEWVEDWVPRSSAHGSWGAGISPTGDYQYFAGAATSGEPGALLRGGSFSSGALAGPLTVFGDHSPSALGANIGVRCAR